MKCTEVHFDSFLYGGFITSKGKENVLVFWDFWDTFGRFLGLFLWLVFWGFCWWFLIFSYFSAIKDIWALQSLHNHIMNVSDSRQFWGWLFEDFWRFFWQSFIFFTGDHFFNSRRFLGFAQSHRERVQVGQRLRLLPVQAGIFLFYDFPKKSFHKVQLSWEGYKNLAQSIFLKVLTLQSNKYPVRDIKKQFSNSRIQSAAKCLWKEKQCLNVFLK